MSRNRVRRNSATSAKSCRVLESQSAVIANHSVFPSKMPNQFGSMAACPHKSQVRIRFAYSSLPRNRKCSCRANHKLLGKRLLVVDPIHRLCLREPERLQSPEETSPRRLLEEPT